MRLVAWNCRRGFWGKHEALFQLKPDIAIIPEASQSCLDALECLTTSRVWVGANKWDGVAIISFNGWQLTRAELPVAESWFVPVIASKADVAVQVVGVWVKKRIDYVKPTLRALEALQEFIIASPTFVLGDFNQSVNFDKGCGPGRRFQDVLSAFDKMKMGSAWHACRGEVHGVESRPTFHLNHKAHLPFHIDYAFVPRNYVSVTDVQIGKFDDYVAWSDHLPLTLDVGL
jgi:hypothetical protein